MSAAPSGSSGGLPTRSEIEELDTSELGYAATGWRTAATQSEDAFEQHRQNIASPGGTTWEGDALREADGIAEAGVNDISAAKREALDAITAAEDDGFTVGEDLSVTDTRRYDITTAVERNRAATEHAEDIRWFAERLVQATAFVDERLQSKAADLEGIRFEGEGEDHDGEPRMQLVSNEFKLNPQDGGEDPDDSGYKPHDKYPDHKPNGEWGPGNSGLEGHAEAQKAFDKREERTGIPIERKLIWVYLTDPRRGRSCGGSTTGWNRSRDSRASTPALNTSSGRRTAPTTSRPSTVS